MGEQKNVQQNRGDKKSKKQDDQPKAPRRSNYTEARKKKNVKRNLARDAKRAQKAKQAATPHGTARLERRRLARLAAVEAAGLPGLTVFNHEPAAPPPTEAPMSRPNTILAAAFETAKKQTEQ